MKRKARLKKKKKYLKKRNIDWNQFLQITKIIELNDICQKNNNNNFCKSPLKMESNIKEESFNISKKLDKIETNSNNENNHVTDEKSEIKTSIKINNDEYINPENTYDKAKTKSSNRKGDNIEHRNINSEFKNAAGDPNGVLEKSDVDIVEIKKDGNCLYRSFSYFLFGTQIYFQEIKKLIIDWIENNYEQFKNFFGDDEKNNINREQLANEEYEYTKQDNSWGGDLQINIFCILFNFDVAVFTELNGKYKRYFLFHIPEIIPDELIILLYTGTHYNLIYPKRNNEKNFKFYNNPKEIRSNTLIQKSGENITFIKKEKTYISVNYAKSSNIYNEIFEYLLSIKRNNVNIQNMQSKFPKMNYNQILSKFPIIYPERINSKSYNDTIQRANFRKLCTKFKINNDNRLEINNPYTSDINNNENNWYYIPYKDEKEIILNELHWKNNHCGRDAMKDLLKSNKWYWYGFYLDIIDFIKRCPFCDNSKSKFKKLNTGIKVILDKGPHYRYIADLWYLSKDISKISGFKYILDIIDHFSKWYQGYPLKTKNSEEILTYIDLFIQSFGNPVIFQSDNGLEFCNSDLTNYCINNDIKIVHGRPRHPQSQGACEVCHKEIKKYIYTKYLEDKENFNLNKALVEIINIHNNKKHTITEEIPKMIRDITDKEFIENINERIVKNIGRKNKNKDIIDYNHYYCIESDLIIKSNKLLKARKKKKYVIKIPILILSETEKENEFLIEIQKNTNNLIKGDTYLISGDLLLETTNDIWKQLIE